VNQINNKKVKKMIEGKMTTEEYLRELKKEAIKEDLLQAFMHGVGTERAVGNTGGILYDGNYTLDPREMALDWYDNVIK
jgi:hypothetical protein